MKFMNTLIVASAIRYYRIQYFCQTIIHTVSKCIQKCLIRNKKSPLTLTRIRNIHVYNCLIVKFIDNCKSILTPETFLM